MTKNGAKEIIVPLSYILYRVMLCLCGQGLLGHICYIPFLQRDGAVYGSFSRACEYGEGG